MTTQNQKPSNKVVKKVDMAMPIKSKKDVIQTIALAESSFRDIRKNVGGTKWDMERSLAAQIITSSMGTKNDLTKVTRDSMGQAMTNLAMTGLSLSPELRQGYFVRRGNKLYFTSSYMGKIDMMYRTGVVKLFKVKLVYENDEFLQIEGEESKIIHKPKAFGDKGKIMGGYYIAKLANGEMLSDTMDIADILHIRDTYSESKDSSFSPWKNEFASMVKKTIVNQAWKFMPKLGISEDMIRAMEADSRLDKEQFDEWKDRQEQLEEDDFLDDAPEDDYYTDAEVVEDKKEEKKSPAKEDPPPEKTPEDERAYVDDDGNVEIKKTQPGGLFPEV